MRTRKKALIGAALMAVLAAMLAGCGGPQASAGQQAENKQQAQATRDLVNNQPLPHFTYSQIRQNLIEIETAQANGVQTTSFFFNQGVRDPIKSCPSIGAPIASTASLSNPQQTVDGSGSNGGGNVVIGQMDPNGTYQPPHSMGTYVICINAQGKPYASYWEGFIDTEFGPATWNKTTHQVEMVGQPSFKFSTGK